MISRQSFCVVVVAGRLGKDPEVRYSPTGTAFARFSLATTEVWQSQGGEKKERTDWHNIEAMGKTAEFCEKYLNKGRMVLVEGKLRYDQWTDKDGQKRTATKIAASSVTTLEKQARDPMGEYTPEEPTGEPPVDDSGDQELPF